MGGVRVPGLNSGSMSIKLADIESRPAGVHLLHVSPLLSPRELREEIPVPPGVAREIRHSRDTVRAIIRGEDPRLLAIVGPCSIHDPTAALEYARRIRDLVDRLSGRLFVVMRVYVDKPRSTIGWRGSAVLILSI